MITMFDTTQVEKALQEGFTYEDMLPYMIRDLDLNPDEIALAQQKGITAKQLVERGLKKAGPVERAVAATPEKGFTDPNLPESFNFGRVATSGGIGAAVGSVIPGVGTVFGGVSGIASGIAGEYARIFGLSDAEIMGAEFLGGGFPQAAYKVVKFVGNKTLPSALIPPFLSTKNQDVRSIYRAKEWLYGPTKFKGMYTTKVSDSTQKVLRDKYNIIGDNRKKVSTVVRQQMLDGIDSTAMQTITIKTAKKQPKGKLIVPKSVADDLAQETTTKQVPNVFFHSPEFKTMLGELQILAKRGIIDKEDIGKVMSRAANQLDPKIGVREGALDLLNFIQNRGIKESKKVGERVAEISEGTQNSLRKAFDGWLQRNSDEASYNTLKGIEREEFIAEAIDSINTMVKTNFGMKDREFRAALDNIKQRPEGVSRFYEGLMAHFKGLGETARTKTSDLIDIPLVGRTKVGMSVSEDVAKEEWKRLVPAIEDSGVLSKNQIELITKKLEDLPYTADTAKRFTVVKDIIMSGLTGGAAAEIQKKLEKEEVLVPISL